MDTERWQCIEEIYTAVLSVNADDLERDLDARCAGDAALRREVEALLDAADAARQRFARLAAVAVGGTPEAEAMLRSAGARIGHYRLIRQLGRGGMGVVYLAERADEQFDKQVAVKLLPVGLVTPEARQRFQREREILAGLEHPNIARLLDGGITEEGTPYYVLEYVAGECLDEYSRQHKLGISECLDLFDRICQAVAYAHGKLIVHRDVKPDNILVGSDGRPKLLDFGVAKLLDDASGAAATVTGADSRLLSLAYAAPELLQGQAVTTACDVYSLGAVLFELLAGSPPFDFKGRSSRERLEAILHQSPSLPSVVCESPRRAKALKGDLDTIVAMAMRKEPERRYATVEGLRLDLVRYRENLPVTASPDTTRYRVAKFWRRHRLGVAATAAVMLALAIGLGAALWQMQVATAARDQTSHVNQFLRDILNSPRSVYSGPKVAFVDVLDQAADRLKSDFPKASIVRAELAVTLGRTFDSLGQYEQAVFWAQRARFDFEALQGKDAPATLSTMLVLVEALDEAGRTEEALALLDQVTSRARALPAGHEIHVKLLVRRFVLLQGSDPEAALAALDQAVGLAPQTRWADPRDRAVLECSRLAGTAMRGDFDAMERIARELLAWSLEVNGPRHNTTLCAVSRLSQALARQARPAEAIVVIQDYLPLAEAWLGESNQQVLDLRTALGVALKSAGRVADSAAVHQRVVDAMDEVPGFSPESRIVSMLNLAATWQEMGDYTRAEPVILEALALAGDALGEGHQTVCLLKANLSELRLLTERADSALELSRQAHACFSQVVAPGHPYLLVTRAMEGGALTRQGRYGEALEVLQGLPERIAPILGEADANLANARAWLGEALTGLGRAQEARPYLEAAYVVRLKQLGADNPRTRHVAELMQRP